MATLAILAMLSGICTWYRPGGRLAKDAVREIFLGMVLALARGEVPAEAVAAPSPALSRRNGVARAGAA